MSDKDGGPATAVRGKKPNWEHIAREMFKRVDMACSMKISGSPMIYNIKTGEMQHWLDYMADGLRLMPGIEIDEAKLARAKRTRKSRKGSTP